MPESNHPTYSNLDTTLLFNSLSDILQDQNTVSKLKTIEDYDKQSSEKQLRAWAINLELLGEDIENNLPFILPEVFDGLERLCESIVLKSRNKGRDAKTKKESYRRRLRFAAGFILNLVEMAREEAMEEDEEIARFWLLASEQALREVWE